MIYKDIIERPPWMVKLTVHATDRCEEKGIPYDAVIATIKGGAIKRFGKNYIKFVKEYKQGRLICVGESKGHNKITIFTVERA